jgi:tRNA splicing endonuclease
MAPPCKETVNTRALDFISVMHTCNGVYKTMIHAHVVVAKKTWIFFL